MDTWGQHMSPGTYWMLTKPGALGGQEMMLENQQVVHGDTGHRPYDSAEPRRAPNHCALHNPTQSPSCGHRIGPQSGKEAAKVSREKAAMREILHGTSNNICSMTEIQSFELRIAETMQL